MSHKTQEKDMFESNSDVGASNFRNSKIKSYSTSNSCLPRPTLEFTKEKGCGESRRTSIIPIAQERLLKRRPRLNQTTLLPRQDIQEDQTEKKTMDNLFVSQVHQPMLSPKAKVFRTLSPRPPNGPKADSEERSQDKLQKGSSHGRRVSHMFQKEPNSNQEHVDSYMSQQDLNIQLSTVERQNHGPSNGNRIPHKSRSRFYPRQPKSQVNNSTFIEIQLINPDTKSPLEYEEAATIFQNGNLKLKSHQSKNNENRNATEKPRFRQLPQELVAKQQSKRMSETDKGIQRNRRRDEQADWMEELKSPRNYHGKEEGQQSENPPMENLSLSQDYQPVLSPTPPKSPKGSKSHSKMHPQYQLKKESVRGTERRVRQNDPKFNQDNTHNHCEELPKQENLNIHVYAVDQKNECPAYKNKSPHKERRKFYSRQPTSPVNDPSFIEIQLINPVPKSTLPHDEETPFFTNDVDLTVKSRQTKQKGKNHCRNATEQPRYRQLQHDCGIQQQPRRMTETATNRQQEISTNEHDDWFEESRSSNSNHEENSQTTDHSSISMKDMKTRNHSIFGRIYSRLTQTQEQHQTPQSRYGRAASKDRQVLARRRCTLRRSEVCDSLDQFRRKRTQTRALMKRLGDENVTEMYK